MCLGRERDLDIDDIMYLQRSIPCACDCVPVLLWVGAGVGDVGAAGKLDEGDSGAELAGAVCMGLDAVHGDQVVDVGVEVGPGDVEGEQTGVVEVCMEACECVVCVALDDCADGVLVDHGEDIYCSDDELGEGTEGAGPNWCSECARCYAKAEDAGKRVKDECLGRKGGVGAWAGAGDCAGEGGLGECSACRSDGPGDICAYHLRMCGQGGRTSGAGWPRRCLRRAGA